jgi:hypothetical protein
MFDMLPILAGAGLGFLKNKLIDKPAEQRSRKMNAEIMRYSPWTGMQGPGVKEAGSVFGSMLQGGALGSMATPLMTGIAAPTASMSAPAAAASAGASPLAVAPQSLAKPLTMASAKPTWFDLSNAMFPYQK